MIFAGGATAAGQRSDASLSGTYQDQFDQGDFAGTLVGNGVCPCDLTLDIDVPGAVPFQFVGQRVDENRIVGSYRGVGFDVPTTLTRQ